MTTDWRWPDYCRRIWDGKYRLKDKDGNAVDETIEQTWGRVAYALAQPEKDIEVRRKWAVEFHGAMRNFKFIPAGRILAGAGTERNVTLFNCYVMGRIGDSLDEIFQHLREAALTMQQGGGIGYDFSTLRPKGALVAGVDTEASGPLPFMDTWDAMCKTIMSAGNRRGAMMGMLRCDHPDIEAFVDAKREPGRFRNFNLSVLVTDGFMKAVREDRNWVLAWPLPQVTEGLGDTTIGKNVRARDLWDRIMRATYDVAEPGVAFIDRINDCNNLKYCETIFATNPCGEQPLPPYGACLLGSINLAALVEQPFTSNADLPPQKLDELTRTAVRMLDNVIEISKFPLKAQREEAFAKRRIGLGITGLADALIMCGLRYGSREAVEVTQRWMREIQTSAYDASANLAQEKGPFPLYDKELFKKSSKDAGFEYLAPLRNSHLLSIAPTGTISFMAGNVSSGIEPVFDFEYERNVLQPDGSRRKETVQDYAWRYLKSIDPKATDNPFKDNIWVTAQDLTPEDHLAMLAAVQEYVDASVSKTINLPKEISFENFKSVYERAYELGCKSCTTYRPNEVTGAVLEVKREMSQEETLNVVSLPHPTEAPLARPEALPGTTYKLKWPDSEHALYVTINDLVNDPQWAPKGRPFEIFIASKNMEHYAWVVALTRMISAVFRRGGDVSFVVEELKAVFDPRGGVWLDRKYVPSIVAAIGGVVERHMKTIGFIPEEASVVDPEPSADVVVQTSAIGAVMVPKQCPKCGSAAVVLVEGCDVCRDCNWSRCD